MKRQRIGILIIGQTPRPDLTAPLDGLGRTYDLVIRGALDDLSAGDLPDAGGGSYPLVTRMRDGTLITVDEAFLTPLLQTAIDDLEQEDVVLSLLLCAGPFHDLTSTRPLLRPFQLAVQTLQSLGLPRPGIVVPTDDQRGPAERKWTAAGFAPVIWSMETRPAALPVEHWLPSQASNHADLSALVFDYVGYPLDTVQRLQTLTPLPVLDLGHLAVAALEAMLSQGHA